jgi:HPt (histidine-containing phosphotransfer) domain-containing protein
MRPRNTASSGSSDLLGVLRSARLGEDTCSVHDLAHSVHMIADIYMREDIQ